MRILLTLFVCTLSLALFAANTEPSKVLSAKSPAHRAALMELYTSEGCSSCPPADKWLSSMKQSGVTGDKLIALAFHVTYWDYIGWNDPFASKVYDSRQRELARLSSKPRVYTPQFIFNGDDYRSYNQFANDLSSVLTQTASVDLAVTATLSEKGSADIDIKTDITKSKLNEVAIYFAVYENNLSSDVKDGENEGEFLKHDFVVRNLYGPYIQSRPELKSTIEKDITFKSDWKRNDMGLAVFAQNPHSGEILQAMRLEFGQ